MAVAIFLIHLFLLYVDLRHKAAGLWTAMPGYLYLFYSHIVLETGLLFFILIMTISKPASAKDVRVSHMAVAVSFMLFFLAWSAALSSVDQMIHGLIAVHIMAVFGIAVAFYVTGATSLMMYVAAHVFFVVGISQTQPNHDVLLGHYINGSALAVVAWVLSRLVFSARVREFLNTKTIERQKIEIEDTKKKIESILKNILPENVVKQIDGRDYPPPEYNPSTTIVFADFVSFYKIAETSDAREVLKILEEMSNAFDESVRKHRLEKLRTIGDCYMFAGGLSTENNQLVDTVEGALEIRDIVCKFAKGIKTKTGHEWALRIGVHTGPAITGIIGTWRFIYDVWGPTVNIASRLEAASLPNKINVSQRVFDQLLETDRYTLEPRGALAIKNMEPVDMYFVERKV
ncbi:MAG TPA: adenylate/guanylate cyclase domain-containing protein [Candidatus Acidoferrales bacterium]|nr:adenylate/guanylate cyclase domain-containing protein [Candidatus Acidoferrales bacterium]